MGVHDVGKEYDQERLHTTVSDSGRSGSFVLSLTASSVIISLQFTPRMWCFDCTWIDRIITLLCAYFMSHSKYVNTSVILHRKTYYVLDSSVSRSALNRCLKLSLCGSYTHGVSSSRPMDQLQRKTSILDMKQHPVLQYQWQAKCSVDCDWALLMESSDLHGNGGDGNPAGMEANVAGFPREWTYNLAGIPRECLFIYILPYNVLL